MVAISAGIGGALLWQERSRTLAEQARTADALAQVQINFDHAEAERERAEANFRQARAAVDRMLTRAANELKDVPHMGKIQSSGIPFQRPVLF